MVKYRKAVRDKIPDIIRESGASCVVKTLPDDEFLLEIEKKLKEEVEEYFQSRSPFELADVIEVIYRIIELRDISREELEKMRIEKLKKRGGYMKNLFLIEIIP